MHLYLADTNVKWFDNADRGLMHLYLANGDIRNFDSGATGLQNANATCKFLISYYYFKTRKVEELAARWQPLQLFADSGAFSAWSLGGQIDVHEYADWLHKYKHLFAVYANLDVKGDIDASLRNQQILEEKGLHPLPVFHRYEPWSVLEEHGAGLPLHRIGRAGRRHRSVERHALAHQGVSHRRGQGGLSRFRHDQFLPDEGTAVAFGRLVQLEQRRALRASQGVGHQPAQVPELQAEGLSGLPEARRGAQAAGL